MPPMVVAAIGAWFSDTIKRMTQDLFRQDAYLRECSAQITAVTADGAIVLDRPVFYPQGGGQAGDSGLLLRAYGSSITIANTRKGKDAQSNATADIVHIPAPGQQARMAQWTPGTAVPARIAWARRHRMMRLHTPTHLLCHLVPPLVKGYSI